MGGELMFTGLVAARGRVLGVRREAAGALLTVSAEGLDEDLAGGESIAVNGVCLTATRVEGFTFGADVLSETLRRSSLGALAEGDEVNLERALRAQDRLGGHFVQGHVDGVGEIEHLSGGELALAVRIAAPVELLRYVVEKGSIAVDGVSLTVAEIDAGAFVVALIPETLDRTTLGSLEPGRRVNLEVDVLAKYVERLVSHTVRAR
ncbi:MAG: riboflavin synthase [Thermoleophilaceae bacterium]